MANLHHQILIIGGGAAGITVAASLKRHAEGKSLNIAIVDPADNHYYQPAFTLVGGGCYSLAKTRRRMASLIPNGVDWFQQAATNIDAENNSVELANGDKITYDYLVVCPGLVLDWDAIEGLKDAIGKGGVCTNYSPEYTEYTWKCIQNTKKGDKLFFTQAPLPFKCPGAPQKIAYLAADYLKGKGMLADCDVHFTNPGPGMFGVPYFAKQLSVIADRYGIHKDLLHKLTKIDGKAKKATFEVVDGDNKGEIKELDYDMIHVTPHQKTPDFLHGSSVSNDAGYVGVHQNSMQHVKYPNVFGLGDACSTPNSKTAAAVRKQAPTVVQNIKNLMDGKAIEETYNGYGSCPLTTARGKVLMAEFIYGGKVTPTMPYIARPNEESTLMWYTKTIGLPLLYWEFMLKGYEKFLEPQLDYDTGE
ncbi:MAG: pyridine nucleotide-disulfide oxidoreductase [Cycloclasticus sp. symbiont of Poecilosclerida sp. M]|nr:MAG: pyridine nucleotide-disulfide oxidoreductase [Cycloclasticus sp. symbiont of Poecilosclerida sp. M]